MQKTKDVLAAVWGSHKENKNLWQIFDKRKKVLQVQHLAINENHTYRAACNAESSQDW